MKIRLTALLLALVMVLGLAGCSETSDAPGTSASATGMAADPNRIVLDTPVILADDENVKIELTGFHQEIRYNADKTETMGKFLDFHLTNKTTQEFRIGMDAYAGDEMVNALDVSQGPAPGKSGRFSMYICYSDDTTLGSIDELYTLNGTFELRITQGSTITNDYIYVPFSIPAAMAGVPVPDHESAAVPENVTIDAIAVDDSFRKKDGSDLQRVHLFYTVTATDTNLEVDSKYTKMVINGVNEYSGAHYFNALDYAPSYLYQDYLRDVYMGSQQKVVTTFEIPPADLSPGRAIRLSDTQVPGMELLQLNTDDIQHFDSIHALCQAIDPQGYAQAADDRSLPSDAMLLEIDGKLRPTIWGAQGDRGTFLLEFKEGTTYLFTSNKGMYSPGRYTITKKYIVLLEDGSGTTLEIPYSYVNGDLDLDVATAIDNGKN